jgi:hypothetical protein
MSVEDRPSPLPGDIRALIDADLRAPGMSSDAQERVLRRMGAGFVAAGVATTIATATTASAAAGAATGASTGIVYGFLARKATIIAAAFLLGGATGVGGYVVARNVGEAHRVTPVVTTAQPNAPPVVAPIACVTGPVTPIATTAPVPVETAAPPVVVAPPAPVTTSVAIASASAGHDTDLASERALIEMARSALSHGNPIQALDAVGRHAAKFPYGQLVEERENIAIHALADAGRLDEARARAERFRKRFPKSIFLPSIDAAVGTAP